MPQRVDPDSGHRIEGVFLLPSSSRHALVACLFVALSCAGHAVAQNLSRPEALLKKMTLVEKLGQLVQRAGGRSKSLNSKLDDAEFMRVQARQVAEEKAAKLGVKLVFPIFFCILPSLFVVTVGPMAIKIVRELIPMVNSI